MAQTDSSNRPESTMSWFRVLIVGLVVVLVVIGLMLIVMSLARLPARPVPGEVNALALSNDQCVVCHRKATAGIVEQYGFSTMAAAGISCQICHEVSADYGGAVPHEGTYVLRTPSAAKCRECHAAEVAQFAQSRHGLPAYVAYAGSKDLAPDLLKQYESIPEGSYAPDKSRNALYALEGPAVTRFACEVCHNVGLPHADGSVGQCQKCHLRHEFSLEQVRKPETCNACHIGPDHPQWEIYQESPHGIAYMTGGYKWNWHEEPGNLGVTDMPAPTCATCHMSGFGTSSTTHDVGDRLTWYLFAPVSERRPAWQDNLVRMKGVCFSCHNRNFIESFYSSADEATAAINAWVVESQDIVKPLSEAGLLTDEPFDEPIDFTSFNLWHHWGRTAKFGTWMQGPDYVQWHGAYEILHDLAELREMTANKLDKAEERP